MAGGLIQIVAYGAQDIYLTNNPQITYFKTVYKRHTNFSLEAFEYTVLPVPDWGSKRTVKIIKNGDLITKMYLKIVVSRVEVDPHERFAWVRRLGYALLNSIDLDIGGVKVDRQSGAWLDVWHELARSSKHDKGFQKLVGDVSKMTELNNRSKPEYVIYVPLKFWFNRYYGLALPMLGIQYHEVRLHIHFNKLENLIVTSVDYDRDKLKKIKMLDVSAVVDYVYLDIEERRRFGYLGHEYLVEQVQTDSFNQVVKPDNRIRLTFNHPMKEIMWVSTNGLYRSNRRFLCYSNSDNWCSELKHCSQQLLLDSLFLAEELCGEEGEWERFLPGEEGVTHNGNICITNKGCLPLFINTDSLKICDQSITGKVCANVTVTPKNKITVDSLWSDITIDDVSTPVDLMEDTRVCRSSDVLINQFSNYGLYLDGSVNPVQSTRLDFNDEERIPPRSGTFTNYLHPEMHHSNTPKDGVNCYCFSMEPELHQPMGTANFSKIEAVFLTVILKKGAVQEGSFITVFGLNYNVFRVMNGLTGMSYNG